MQQTALLILDQTHLSDWAASFILDQTHLSDWAALLILDQTHLSDWAASLILDQTHLSDWAALLILDQTHLSDWAALPCIAPPPPAALTGQLSCAPRLDPLPTPYITDRHPIPTPTLNKKAACSSETLIYTHKTHGEKKKKGDTWQLSAVQEICFFIKIEHSLLSSKNPTTGSYTVYCINFLISVYTLRWDYVPPNERSEFCLTSAKMF
jgi:hypothetical protein